MLMLSVPHMPLDFGCHYVNVSLIFPVTRKRKKNRTFITTKTNSGCVHNKKAKQYFLFMVADEEQPKWQNKRQIISGTKHSRVCVKGIVSCHAFG